MKLLKIALTAALPLGLSGAAMADEIMITPQPAGSTLTISAVTITNDGWLVIHAIKDGKPVLPGSIGHVAVKAGTTENVIVELDTPTKSGDKVLTMLHVDQGYVGTYEFPGPDHPVVQNGKPVVNPMQIN